MSLCVTNVKGHGLLPLPEGDFDHEVTVRQIYTIFLALVLWFTGCIGCNIILKHLQRSM